MKTVHLSQLNRVVRGMLAMLLLLGPLLIAARPVHAASTTTVSWNDVKQTIDGFGASSAWVAGSIRALPSDTRTGLLDLLFSPTSGIGLSMLRNRIPSDLQASDGSWDWSVDEDARWLIGEARSRGVSTVWSTPWSPPAWMKTNNNVNNGGSVSTDKYQDYANYLSRYIREYASSYNITIDAVSLANEPDLTTEYESSRWSSTQFRDFIKNYLKPTFANDNVSAKVIISEHSTWSDSLIKDSLNDSDAVTRVDIAAAHGYSGSVTPFTTARSKNKKVWQTEVSFFEGTNDSSISNGLHWAKHIHDYLVSAEVNAWHYWWLLTSKTTGEALVNRSGDTYSVNKRLYTIGNFSRFVRPGYVRIGATANPATDVYVSAYRENSTDGKLVIVAINKNSSSHALTVSLDGATATSVTPYVTSSTQDLQVQTNISVSNNAFSTTLPANSVTTFVGTAQGNTLPIDNDFNNGTSGSAPAGWTISAPTNTSVTVDNTPSTSDKSVKLYDNTTSALASMAKTFSAQSGNMTVEWRFKEATIGRWSRFFVRNGNTNAVELYVHDNGNLVYRNASALDTTVQAVSADTWYKVKLVVKPASGTYDIYVDNMTTPKVTNAPFRNSASSVDGVFFGTGSGYTGTTYINDVRAYN